MNIPKQFSKITDEYYSRHYTLNPELWKGPPVIVYAECAHDPEYTNGHYYSLTLLLSVGEYADRRFLIGVSFGTGKMEKDEIDKEIDTWVIERISDPLFSEIVQEYIDMHEMWESYQDGDHEEHDDCDGCHDHN